MKLQPRTLLLLSMIWACLSASGAFANQTGPGGEGGGSIQVKVPTAAPRIIVGKGTIGIVCRSSEGHIQFIHVVERPDSVPEDLLLRIEAYGHMKYPSDTDGLANVECTLQHISQDDVDALQEPAQGEGPSVPAAQ